MLPRIIEIIEIKDFDVSTKWTTGEIRNINFKKLLSTYPKSIANKILEKGLFSTLALNKESKTIYFPNILKSKDLEGFESLVELDFCPDVLYAFSEKETIINI
jgi:Protein of unknown function (DUF2442)